MLLQRSSIHLSNIRRFLSNRIILGIETSCDDTGVAIIKENGDILSDIVVSQTALHVSNGGIIPPIARNKHREVIDSSVAKCLKNANIKASELDAIAVTSMPGLPLSLGIGCRYAKKLSAKYNLPVIPIHHMQAHALTSMLQYKELTFPFVTLLISGGHCLIAYVHTLEDFRILGKAVDDAPGDILDKIARSLKLRNLGEPYDRISGGASIELMAKSGDPFTYFVRESMHPLYYRKRTCNFSFSGFLTSVQRTIQKLEIEEDLSPDGVLPQASNICASVLYVISFTLIKRLQRAFQYLDEQSILPEFDQRRLVISGGCAANKFFGTMFNRFCEEFNIELFIPSPKLCTDNGLMIAWNGAMKLSSNSSCILYDQNSIQAFNYFSKSPIGLDLTESVNYANIKTEPLNVKKFLQQI